MAKSASLRLHFWILPMDLGKLMKSLFNARVYLYSLYYTSVDLFKPQCEVYTKDRASFVGPIEGIKQFERSI